MNKIENCNPFPAEFTGVLKLNKQYFAFHKYNGLTKILSKPAEKILTVAKAVAEKFAQQKRIHFEPDLLCFDKPVLTILKTGTTWSPAQIDAENVTIVTGFTGGQELIGQFAKAVADEACTDYLPEIGISLSRID